MGAEALDITQFVEAHEDRILRLETGLGHVTEGLATNTARLEAVIGKVAEVIPAMKTELQNCVTPMAQRLTEHIAADTIVSGRVDALTPRVTALETDSTKRRAWKDSTKKFLYALAVGGGSILAKEVVMKLVALTHH